MQVEIIPTLLLNVLFSGKYMHRTCSVLCGIRGSCPIFSDNDLGKSSYVFVNAVYIN